MVFLDVVSVSIVMMIGVPWETAVVSLNERKWTNKNIMNILMIWNGKHSLISEKWVWDDFWPTLRIRQINTTCSYAYSYHSLVIIAIVVIWWPPPLTDWFSSSYLKLFFLSFPILKVKVIIITAVTHISYLTFVCIFDIFFRTLQLSEQFFLVTGQLINPCLQLFSLYCDRYWYMYVNNYTDNQISSIKINTHCSTE